MRRGRLVGESVALVVDNVNDDGVMTARCCAALATSHTTSVFYTPSSRELQRLSRASVWLRSSASRAMDRERESDGRQSEKRRVEKRMWDVDQVWLVQSNRTAAAAAAELHAVYQRAVLQTAEYCGPTVSSRRCRWDFK